MKLLPLLAVAALAAGLYHYRRHLRRAARDLEALSDEELAEGVRAAIAGSTSSPVKVRCTRGIVSLRGTVRRAELDTVLAAALAAPGVTQVTSYLETDEPLGEIGPMQSGIATGV